MRINIYEISINKIINFGFVIIMLIIVSSCEEDNSLVDSYQFADLEVYVSGTLSDNPRSGLKVAIYETQEDAQNETNAISYPQTTDSNGFAYFVTLEPGFRYWVRVDTILIHNINRSQVLTTGFNEMSMTIL